MELKQRIEDSFSTYAAMTIQHRALIDVRDGLKPSQRMAFYSQYVDKITYKNPYKKTHKSVTSAMDHFYLHGNASMEQLLARLARDITMRYPLEDGVGNMGTYTYLDNAAAPRYTEMRLGELATRMIDGIDKECIDVWFDNYDNTEQFPSVLPSLGYYNIVNGTTGIATGVSSSVPQFNLREVNSALIKLLWNPDISFDEIYCVPDFATGGTILNASAVKESLKNGTGASCIIRGDVEYDADKNLLQVKSVPYNVATSNIKKQIAEMFEEGLAAGIERFEDSSEEIVDITIWLSKGTNVNRVIKSLYKHTMIQYYFPINMTMLDMGKSPKVFGWKEALQAHLDHEIVTRTKIHEFEVKRIDKELHIINGMITALANIDEVVENIRSSNNNSESKERLITRFGFSEEQVKAILKITLSRLCKLEIQSFNDKKEELSKEKDYHLLALSDENVLKKEVEKDLRFIAEKFGDDRKTKYIDLDFTSEADDAEPIEKKQLLIHYTNLGNIYTQESTTLLTSRRGGKGSKIKLKDNEAVVQTLSSDNLGAVLAFTNKGQMYSCQTSELPINTKVAAAQLFGFDSSEQLTEITTISRRDQIKYFIFITKQGMIKKTAANEYDKKRGKALKAINLRDGDEVVSVHFVNTEPIGILTSQGNYVIINTEDINPISRSSIGIRAVKLGDDDYVIDSKIINGKYLLTASANGIIKKSSLDEFPICNRGIKGKKISGTQENDRIIKFLTFSENCDIIIVQDKGQIKFNTSELRLLSREAIGVKAIQLNENRKVVDLIKS